MKSNFAVTFRINSWISTKTVPEKVTETKCCEDTEQHFKNGHFSPDGFLDLQQSLCNIN